MLYHWKRPQGNRINYVSFKKAKNNEGRYSRNIGGSKLAMANITFTIPSVLNQGGGELKIEISVSSLSEAFAKISEKMGDDFKRRVLDGDGTPRSLINIYINGKNAKFSGGMEASLKDSDEVYILPAVAGGSDELSSKELDRFSRQIMLEEIGYQGQLKLKNAKVCVVGTGGLGNPITTRLAAMEIRRASCRERV